MSKPPAFQFYAKDWLADQRVATLTLEEKGAYIELLASAWVEGSIPADVGAIAALLRIRPAKAEKVWTVLSGFFLQAPGLPGRLVNRRLEVEREAMDRYRAGQAEKGRAGNRKRWSSDRSGDPSAIADDSPDHRSGDRRCDAPATLRRSPQDRSASASASAGTESEEARSLGTGRSNGTARERRASELFDPPNEPQQPDQSLPRPGSPAAITRLYLENARKIREAGAGVGQAPPLAVGPIYGEPK